MTKKIWRAFSLNIRRLRYRVICVCFTEVCLFDEISNSGCLGFCHWFFKNYWDWTILGGWRRSDSPWTNPLAPPGFSWTVSPKGKEERSCHEPLFRPLLVLSWTERYIPGLQQPFRSLCEKESLVSPTTRQEEWCSLVGLPGWVGAWTNSNVEVNYGIVFDFSILAEVADWDVTSSAYCKGSRCR